MTTSGVWGFSNGSTPVFESRIQSDLLCATTFSHGASALGSNGRKPPYPSILNPFFSPQNASLRLSRVDRFFSPSPTPGANRFFHHLPSSRAVLHLLAPADRVGSLHHFAATNARTFCRVYFFSDFLATLDFSAARLPRLSPCLGRPSVLADCWVASFFPLRTLKLFFFALFVSLSTPRLRVRSLERRKPFSMPPARLSPPPLPPHRFWGRHTQTTFARLHGSSFRRERSDARFLFLATLASRARPLRGRYVSLVTGDRTSNRAGSVPRL